MLISKIYNQNSNNKSNSNKQQNQSGTSNNTRILTPSSIPIFVLPPTIDAFNSNSFKPELNDSDSFDCMSLKLADEDTTSNPNETITNSTKNTTLAKRPTKLSKNATYCSANDLSVDSTNNKSANQSITSLNNLKNTSLNLTSPNHLKPSSKYKMYHTNSISNPSGSVFTPAQTPTGHMRTSVVNAFLEFHNPSNNGLVDEENELKNKENYCNLWVLNNSDNNSNNPSIEYLNEKKSMNGSIKSTDSSCSAYLRKSNNENLDQIHHNNSLIAVHSKPAAASTYMIANHANKHVDEEYINKVKEEEKLQREYLVNLLKQLESEQEAEKTYARLNNNVTSVDDSKQNFMSKKKTKRSKSETFLEINSIGSPLNGNTKLNNNNTQNKTSSNQPNTSIKTSKITKSTLEPNQDENLRRFSFRSLFKSKHLNKSHQNMNTNVNIQKETLKHSNRNLDSINNAFISINMSSNAASLSQLSSNNSSFDMTSSNKLSIMDLTKAATRLSNSNLINPFMDPALNASLLSFKRQSFKLSRGINQRKNLDDDIDADNDDLNQFEDVEKAFNDFYLNNKIENPIRDGCTSLSHDDLNNLNKFSKAKPRRSLLSNLFRSHRDPDNSKRFRFFKNRSKVVLSYYDGGTNNFGECMNALQNLNLALIESEFKRHSVKDIIYLELNKSLFSSPMIKRNHNPETNAFIDVSIERLQQNSKNLHVLSMNLKNLKVEPLFEINHVKSKLTYFKISLVDSEEISNECNSSNNKSNQANLTTNNSNGKSKAKNYARIQRIKRIKLKFNANNKNLQKPVDFDLNDDHFMSVNNEATLMLTQPNQVNTRKSLAEPLYFFLFSIELHSYLPVSRKILSSTFSKKKKIYRGLCQINENFIRMTQFTKKFELNEV